VVRAVAQAESLHPGALTNTDFRQVRPEAMLAMKATDPAGVYIIFPSSSATFAINQWIYHPTISLPRISAETLRAGCAAESKVSAFKKAHSDSKPGEAAAMFVHSGGLYTAYRQKFQVLLLTPERFRWLEASPAIVCTVEAGYPDGSYLALAANDNPVVRRDLPSWVPLELAFDLPDQPPVASSGNVAENQMVAARRTLHVPEPGSAKLTATVEGSADPSLPFIWDLNGDGRWDVAAKYIPAEISGTFEYEIYFNDPNAPRPRLIGNYLTQLFT
jgi:hypothetical protein